MAIFSGSAGGGGRGPGFGLLLALGIGLAGCADSAGPAGQPIQLSATMKLAADSLTLTLRVLNVSDTTQVLEWFAECRGGHPADFALYRDAGLTQTVWKPGSPNSCSTVEAEMSLAPNGSGTIRGLPVAVGGILGDSIAAGRYYVAVHPHGLRIRPKGGSYDMPVDARVPAGPVDLVATLR